ncbi:MAG: DNA topoisomerase IB [Thermoanaerobaculia bacterium]
MGRKGVRRRWYLDTHGIRRTGSKPNFHYVTASGKDVEDEKTLQRIRKLGIPPAWREVRIARSDSSPLQAVGIDARGRTQYRYHSRFRQKRDEEKFLRIVRFGESLPKLRRRVSRDLGRKDLDREHVLSAIVRLIDQGFFRVGNDRSARSESTYGLTTVRKNHVRVSGEDVLFDYIGKWKKPHRRAIRDPAVARLVKKLRRLGKKDDELFRYLKGSRMIDIKDRHVNEYIQQTIGEDFTAKDFRTWAGTLLCSIALAMQGQATTKKERKRRVRKAIEATASLLGNTPAVSRSSYICPRLLEDFMGGREVETLPRSRRARPVARRGLSNEERALLKYLRETIADRRKSPRAA